MFKIAIKLCVLLVVLFIGRTYFVAHSVDRTQESIKQSLQQLDPDVDQDQLEQQIVKNKLAQDNKLLLFYAALTILAVILFYGDVNGMINQKVGAILLLCLFGSGCRQPFEPNKLEIIQSQEEAFLLPFKGDVKEQKSTQTEEYLRENLVFTKQIRIPQQWVSRGYENILWNGEWQDAAMLIKVDKSPVTREWTADANSGTSDKNEAIWVMTSDQVEFSTGWTCTARIASRDDAIKFLHNYPSGSLSSVMDSELRARLQAEFGLEVTDLPMEALRKEATPHIVKVRESVIKFFAERGISITNLGITGGFVYKNEKIKDTMVDVFNAEQQKAIAEAGTVRQAELNKQEILKSEALAKAVMLKAKAESDSIKLIADAKKYEIDQAQTNSETYLELKRLELEKEKMLKWDGKFPTYYMGENNVDMLLQIPNQEIKK